MDEGLVAETNNTVRMFGNRSASAVDNASAKLKMFDPVSFSVSHFTLHRSYSDEKVRTEGISEKAAASVLRSLSEHLSDFTSTDGTSFDARGCPGACD